MKGTLRISSTLALPMEAVTQTFAILAKRGSGKTYTGTVLAEEMVDAHQACAIIDPVGVWWGLRAGANPKDEGLDVLVMGGDHGDVPLERTGGEMVAEFIVEARRPVVLDLSLFRKGEQTEFVTDFAETMYRRNRAPIWLSCAKRWRRPFSSKSGTFSNYLAKLRTNGWAEGGREGMRITDAGVAALGAYDPLPTGRALLEHWLAELGGGSGASRMLRALAEAHPGTLSRDQVGEAASISPGSGTFSNYLAKLRTLELVQDVGRDLRASPEFFL